MLYLDASVLLHDYLDQPGALDAREIWNRDVELVSSFLLIAEVPVVLRRASLTKSALTQRLERFGEHLERISIFTNAMSVAELIRRDDRFSDARTLDALHAACAWSIQEATDHPIKIMTSDKRLALTCRKLRMKVEILG